MARCRQRARGADTAATSAPVPVRINAAVIGLAILINGWLWFGLPLLLPLVGAEWGWTLVAVVALTTTHWSLLHEAFHGILFHAPRSNRAVGRVLSILLCCSFRTLKFGHLMHHRFNRSGLDRTEVLTPADHRRVGAWAYYYGRLTFGLYWVEVLGGWSTLLPKRTVAQVVDHLFGEVDTDGRTRHTAAKAQLLSPPALAEMRVDAVATLALMAVGFWLYGDAWWMLAAALAGRGFMISFFDNPYHYGTPLNATLFAWNLALPRPLERAILNFNLHGAHHLRPSLPWTALPAFAREGGLPCQDGYFRASLRQLKGPLRQDALPVAEDASAGGRVAAPRDCTALSEA